MATRATTKTTTKKPSKISDKETKAHAKPARKSPGTISALPKIKGPAPKVVEAKVEPAPEPPKPKETVSLIDEPVAKTPRKKAEEAKSFKVLPRISRIKEPEIPTPVASPSAPAEVSEPVAQGEEKIIHIK